MPFKHRFVYSHFESHEVTTECIQCCGLKPDADSLERASARGVLLSCCPLFPDVLTQSTVNSFGVGE